MTAANRDLLVPEIARAAEELLAVAAAPDLPAGMVVLPLTPGLQANGASIGSGHDLALANGCRPGAVAVKVDVAGIIGLALDADPNHPDLAIADARVVAEQVAIHEVAHALVADLDGEHGVAEAIARVQAAEAMPPRGGADVHHARWAAAYGVLAARAARLRPGQLKSLVRFELTTLYGIDAVAVAEALGEVADEVSLRELLVVGGAAARRVVAACPPDAERQVVIEHRRQHGAAGGVVTAT